MGFSTEVFWPDSFGPQPLSMPSEIRTAKGNAYRTNFFMLMQTQGFMRNRTLN